VILQQLGIDDRKLKAAAKKGNAAADTASCLFSFAIMLAGFSSVDT